MIDGKKVLAIIPARGGSKGIPRKNIKILAGKPLIAWTIEEAKKSKYIDRLILSSDDEEIIKVAKEWGCEVPFKRPKIISNDNTPMYKVVLHAIKYFQKRGNLFDIVILLEPTSPLREDDDIDKMLRKFIKKYDDFDGIISLGEVNEHPSIMKKIKKSKVYPFCENLIMKLRRQDNEPAYFPYGVAYITKVKEFVKKKTFYTDKTTFYKIKKYQNYEIDTIYDFICVENILKYRRGLE